MIIEIEQAIKITASIVFIIDIGNPSLHFDKCVH